MSLLCHYSPSKTGENQGNQEKVNIRLAVGWQEDLLILFGFAEGLNRFSRPPDSTALAPHRIFRLADLLHTCNGGGYAFTPLDSNLQIRFRFKIRCGRESRMHICILNSGLMGRRLRTLLAR